MATLKPRTGARLSVEEFMELPDTFDKRKMELDEGELYIMPRPRTGHQFLQGELIWHFKGYFNGFDDPAGRCVSRCHRRLVAGAPHTLLA